MRAQNAHILHIIARSDWGGAPRVVKLLATGTDAKVAVACGPGGKLIPELESAGIPVFEQPNLKGPPDPMSDLQALWRLIALLRRESFDIVHCHGTKSGLLGRLAANIAGIPVLFTVHGWGFYNTEYNSLGPIIAAGERGIARTTDAIVCVSENDLRQGGKRGIVQKTDSTVIHNGVPPLEYTDDRVHVRDICDIDPETPTLGSISRLAPQKNPLGILQTAKRLRGRGHDVDTIVVGDGPLMDECREYVREHDLSQVHMLGFQEKALDLFPDFDAFLLPSAFEGFPLTVLESLHAGVPVIGYDVGGVAEAIDEGETGYTVPFGAQEQFADKIEQLLAHPDERFQMSEIAKSVARDRFSAERMIEDYEQVYDRLL